MLCVIAGAGYFGQVILLFPGILSSRQIKFWSTPILSPNRVDRIFVTGEDDSELDAWHLPAADGSPSKFIAVVFHSERGSMNSSFYLQKWLASIGIASYAMDYRGFGNNTGWPNEASLYRDAEQLVRKVSARENIQASELILVGDSVGAAVAAKTASVVGSKKLFLIAPFTTFAAKLGVEKLGFVKKFLQFDLPTGTALEALSGACVVLAGFEHGSSAHFVNALTETAKAKNTAIPFTSATSFSTPELLRQLKGQLGTALKNCSGTSTKL